MNTTAQPRPPDVLLADLPPGRWVVLDSQLTHVLGAADTPEEAIRQAGLAEIDPDDRPVVVQVPDPRMTCLY